MSAGWFPCQHPGRPGDGLQQWHYDGCVGCQVEARRRAREHPDDTHLQWLISRMGMVQPPPLPARETA